MAGGGGGGGGAAPVPLRARWTVGFAASLLAMVRHAPAGSEPAAVGAKVTFRFVLPPAVTENGPVGVQGIEAGVPGQAETPGTFSGQAPGFCTWGVGSFWGPAFTVSNPWEGGFEAMTG